MDGTLDVGVDAEEPLKSAPAWREHACQVMLFILVREVIAKTHDALGTTEEGDLEQGSGTTYRR